MNTPEETETEPGKVWAEMTDDERQEFFRTLAAAADKAKAARAEEMPDDAAALRVLFRAHARLTELGWQDPMYCPKDGTHFQVIEAGSTGIFTAWYDGEWPKGSYWLTAGGDTWPSRPILFRPMPQESNG